MRLIPRAMCTQHPDNANIPPWSSSEVIQGDDEVHEAYLAYSLFGCDEVMWDFEGKDVDVYVVRKLLTRYPDYFREMVLGSNVYLTYRVPNPRIEEAEGKVLMQALETIPTAYDVASRFYGKHVVPIFEVIYPFTTSHLDLLLTLRYYEKVVVGKESIELINGVMVRDWVGEVFPKSIDVIPLVEDMDSLLGIDKIIEGYVKATGRGGIRVFIARSDPAMNYGLVPAVLLAKLAISKAYAVGNRLGVSIYPIIGVGSLPFRGHFHPGNVHRVLEEYRGVYTFTVQSAFRYDNPETSVRGAVSLVKGAAVKEPVPVGRDDEGALLMLIRLYVNRYQRIIEGLAPLINFISQLIPRRRARKLHIGLFGYSRGFRGITLPRAITFVASLYSVGIPPEILGASVLAKMLKEALWGVFEETYVNWRHDLATAAEFACWECLDSLTNLGHGARVDLETLRMVKEDLAALEEMGIKASPRSFESRKHSLLSQLLILSIMNGRIEESRGYITEMARLRKSLG